MSGCSGPIPRDRPRERVAPADLVGEWHVDYRTKTIFNKRSGTWGYGTGTESLTLRSDGTYEQQFADSSGAKLAPSRGAWQLNANRNGDYSVRLSNMRRYFEGATAETIGPQQPAVELLVKAGGSPVANGKDGMLLCVDDEDANICFRR
jgi:hypothetical protein